MAKSSPYSNRIGMTAALDIVEDTLKSLQEKAQQQSQKPEFKNAETNTSFRADCKIQTSKASSISEHQQQKETSVLINRRPSIHSDNSRSHHEVYRGNKAAKAKKKKKSIPGSQASKHSRKLQQQSCSSLPSSHDISHESSTSENSIRTTHSQQRREIPTHSGSNASEKRVSRNRERHSESSPDESLNRRKYESRVKPPQCSREPHQRSKEKGVPHTCKTTKPVSDQSYARPTLTSKFRDSLSSQKKEEKGKENIVTFISCGSKSKSYHVGVIAQQELNHLKHMSSKELEYITVCHTRKQDLKADETGNDSEPVSEETVKRAMANIHHHIALARKHTSKN
ncbi:transcription elongation factor B polypeptide 3 isoform X1 [Procambarus clarkii]|uniref:transcription elongation factor B polypeptide 3 isoform X1 n=2 Tax=Procambarus clarkii TaxID=6728 RepID=UPI0037446946